MSGKNRTSPEKIGPLVHPDMSGKYQTSPNLMMSPWHNNCCREFSWWYPTTLLWVSYDFGTLSQAGIIKWVQEPFLVVHHYGTPRYWNRLPASIVEAYSPQAYKAGLATLAGGGWSYIFRTLNSIPFFPDKSRYHRIFTLSGLFRTCQAPESAAEVDPIAHFGHFRSHLATCTW